nr:hypothetical protein [Pseudomonas sp. BIGb0427]
MTPPTRHIPHHSIIEQNLPTWTRHTSAEHWQRLRHAQQPPQGHAGLEADWFANAAPDLREAVLCRSGLQPDFYGGAGGQAARLAEPDRLCRTAAGRALAGGLWPAT